MYINLILTYGKLYYTLKYIKQYNVNSYLIIVIIIIIFIIYVYIYNILYDDDDDDSLFINQ